jgi:hypothetical protein
VVKEEELTAIGDTLKTLRERVRSRNHQCTILEAVMTKEGYVKGGC